MGEKEIDTAILHEWEVRQAANNFSVGTPNIVILWFQRLFISFLQPSKLVTWPIELWTKWNNLGEPGKFIFKRKPSHILLRVSWQGSFFAHCDCVLSKLRRTYMQKDVWLVPSRKSKIYVNYLLPRSFLSVFCFCGVFFAILIMHWVKEKFWIWGKIINNIRMHMQNRHLKAPYL